MKYLAILFPVFVFLSCENHAFERDKRQIIAKDEVRRMMSRNRSLIVTGFHEDTLANWHDSSFIHPIRYTLDFNYNDSSGIEQRKQGVVIFSQQGNAVVESRIIDN